MPDPTFPYANGGATKSQTAGALINPYSGNTIQNPYGPSVATRVSFAFWRQPVYQIADGSYFTPGCDGPTYVSDPWSKVELGLSTILQYNGQPRTPGIAKVRVEKFRDVDKKKAAGNDGARVTIHGVEPAEVEIEVQIWTPEQLRQLLQLWGILFPAANKGAPPAISVQHPAFTSNLHAIRSLQFVRMEGPEVQPNGIGIFRMRAWEFLKPGTKSATATAAAPLPTVYDQATKSSVSTPGSNSANLAP